MTVGLAHAFGPSVRVNAVMPGPFLTTISKAWDMEVFAERAKTFPMRRAGHADEIAGAALYLASDASTYTTGTILTVDGGAQWSMAGTGEGAPETQLEVNSSPRCSVEHGRNRGRRSRGSARSQLVSNVGRFDMPANQPLWLRVVLRVERTIGEPIESAVRSDTYFDLVSTTTRVRRKVTGTAEGVSRRCLHLLNLPAGSDIRGMRQQLARMERRLNELSHDVAELDGTEPPSVVK